jgi:hypothetical protein
MREMLLFQKVATFLLSGLDVFDVEHAADLAAVKDETLSHNFGFFVRRYEAVRGFGGISYTRRVANPVISSGCRVVAQYSLSSARVLFSLALSLALPPLGSATHCF